ncbi:hypothetical protein GMDG_06452 [Pseudogymnoascus destructans 20631-21]|uniref:MalT-like TPR region domain-containing protein n=1 Tax=Pseudogymnoascus destructans (strain ATCC MYA-4855 / 20631-21) TaxID=658429 RepID=L8FVX0_PSED2|nr:hypothetical protein GMDG_06452 [Pseudogymnoascus destructans 20631-21]
MIIGQSFVLYSRLHFVVWDKRIPRFVLCMIITNIFLLLVPTTVLTYGSNFSSSQKFLGGYIIMEKIEIIGVSIQEIIISGLYIYGTREMLKFNLEGENGSILLQLVGINFVFILMDIGLIATQYSNLFTYQTTLKGLIYSIKLKLEFFVLGKLVRIANRRGGKPEPQDISEFVDTVQVTSDITHADNPNPSMRQHPPPPHMCPEDVSIAVFEHSDRNNMLEGDTSLSSTSRVTGQSSVPSLLVLRQAKPPNLAETGFHVQPFDDITGSNVLLRLVGLDSNLSSNQEKAREITQALGGLPLALNQIGGFITQRKCPLQEFLALYERNAAKIDSRKTGFNEYEHTLSTVWEMSFSKLSGDSCTLLNVLAFLEPDAIDEAILVEGSKLPNWDEEFDFLSDEMDLGDAEAALLQAALIDKSTDDAVLSIHRLVQAAVTRRLTKGDQSKYFDAAVRIVTCGFPNTWREDVGHQFKTWAKCEKYLPHVNQLVNQAKRYNIYSLTAQLYGELLLQCSWYLYEREWYNVARDFISTALETFEDKTTLAFASAVDLSGLIDLDMNNPSSALIPFNTALEIRQKLALTIRLRADTRIDNTYSNMSSLLLRMGKPDEAEDIMRKCPALKDFTDESFINTGNTRYVGNMVLLSRIRLAQGSLDDAMRLASKALTFRQKLHGNRLKTCDSLYDVADMLVRQGCVSSAIELLKQLVAISETLTEAEGQLARASYKLSVLYDENGRPTDSQACKSRAIALKDKLRPELKDGLFEESEFMKLCPFMLW